MTAQEQTAMIGIWKEKALKLWRSTRAVLLVALAVFASRSVVADWNYVPTGSMQPTILIGDVIFVDRVAYDLKVPFTQLHLAQWGNPHRGDVVILDSPADGMRLVKRVIGMPGDVLAMDNDHLIINGKPVRYSPLSAEQLQAIPAKLRTDHLFAIEHLAGVAHEIMINPQRPAIRNFGPITVPSGHYFVMGDNRDNSEDSRYFGFVRRAEILGHATHTIVSWNSNDHYLPRSGRFWRTMH